MSGFDNSDMLSWKTFTQGTPAQQEKEKLKNATKLFGGPGASIVTGTPLGSANNPMNGDPILDHLFKK